MVVILTPLVRPELTTVSVPPRIVATQGEVRGTVVMLSAPETVTGQLTGAGPGTSLSFWVKNAGCSPPTTTAELWTLAISGALPLDGNLNGEVIVPAQLEKKTSPM